MTLVNLNGLRVLNTRPSLQNQELQRLIENAGGVSVQCPAIAIEAVDSNWSNLLPPINTINQAIFISANAVNYFFNVLKTKQITWPETINLIAVGQGTSRELNQFGYPIHSIPEIADSEHLLLLPELQRIENQKILLIKGEGGRELIAETLIRRNAQLTQLMVYRRAIPQFACNELETIWNNDSVDIILFTSQQAMENIFTLLGKKANDWLCGKPCLVLSQRLADKASSLGIKTILVSRPDTIIDVLHQFTQGFFYATKQ